jgi:hypothetical protein
MLGFCFGGFMQIMLDKSPAQIAEYSKRYGHQFWQLRTPLTAYRLAGVPYGLDNGCFSGDLPKAWDRMLAEAEENRPVFVALPDFVGSARRTSDLFAVFESRTIGLPRALVLQDGIGDVDIPWDKIHAVFVGGSDAFKIAPEAIQAAKVAKMLGKWVHVGRVNESRRVRNWLGLADSIDGSGISRFDHMLEDVLSMIRGEHVQACLDVA